LQSNENQKPYDTRKENLLSRIEEIFKILTKEIADIDEKSILSSFANDIIQGINGLSDWAHKKIFLFTCLKLVDMLNDPLKANFSNLIQQFLLNANIDSLVFVLNKVTKSEKEKLLEQYTQQFGQRAIQDQAMFDLLYSIATPNVRMPWMIDLINAHTVRALGKLEELKYKVDDKIKVVDTLLEAATRVPIQEKDKVYNAINEMKCANDVKLRNKLIGQIKALLIGADMPHQEIGYSALQGAHYISATVKRETSRETIEWLRTLEPSNAGQVYAVKSVVINWVDMETAVKSHYADFVFDKLIKRSPNVDSIMLGYEMLHKIKSRYDKENSVYFEDVFVRLESEADPQIKAELKSGLLKLKPTTLSEYNKGFWKKVEGFQIEEKVS